MIIAGDSHVSVFKRGCILPERNNQEVNIQWSGPLNSAHFLQKHVLATKLLELFKSENDWKFLSVGNFEVFLLMDLFKRGEPLEKAILNSVRTYEDLFKQLSENDKFAWMLSFQQIHNYPDDYKKILVEISRSFNNLMLGMCKRINIPVINPLGKILNPDFSVKSELLEDDQMHLKPKYDVLYFEEIEKITGEKIKTKSDNEFEVITSDSVSNVLSNMVNFDPQAFCQLFFKAVEIPENYDQRDIIKIKITLLSLIKDRMKAKGLNINTGFNDDFIAGIMDSLDLVEIYSIISEKFGIELNFNLSLHELNTINKLSEYIFKNLANKLTKRDFVISLKGNFNSPQQKNEILNSEAKISRMNEKDYIALSELEKVASKTNDFAFVELWKALYQYENGNITEAINLLNNAKNKDIKYPLCDNRVDFYLEKWSAIS